MFRSESSGWYAYDSLHIWCQMMRWLHMFNSVMGLQEMRSFWRNSMHMLQALWLTLDACRWGWWAMLIALLFISVWIVVTYARVEKFSVGVRHALGNASSMVDAFDVDIVGNLRQQLSTGATLDNNNYWSKHKSEYLDWHLSLLWLGYLSRYK